MVSFMWLFKSWRLANYRKISILPTLACIYTTPCLCKSLLTALYSCYGDSVWLPINLSIGLRFKTAEKLARLGWATPLKYNYLWKPRCLTSYLISWKQNLSSTNHFPLAFAYTHKDWKMKKIQMTIGKRLVWYTYGSLVGKKSGFNVYNSSPRTAITAIIVISCTFFQSERY